jgi:hypothetical protein
MNTKDQNPEAHQHSLVEAEKTDARKKKDDVTGQTDTTVKEMKARLKEVPHTSAASNHDKEQYSKEDRKKRKRMEPK